jgi:hypothetical protein
MTEQNNSHFMVQRSGNGTEFSAEIGRVQAVGNSNSERHYSFVDASPLKGWNYYRIKQVDHDGKFTFSNIAAVNFDSKSGTPMVIYPNPAKDKLTVEYTAERAGKLDLQVVDGKGAVLISQVMGFSAGRNNETVNIAALSTGVYILRSTDAAGNVSITKFIKQ